jgi:hypothetical protein
VSWRVRWRPAGGGGPRESRTFDREADAKAFAADIQVRPRLGHRARIDSGKVTLDSYISDTWIPVYAPQLAENTRRTYQALYVSHSAPVLGYCTMGPRAVASETKSAPWFAPLSRGCRLGEHRPLRTERARRRALELRLGGRSPGGGDIAHLVQA